MRKAASPRLNMVLGQLLTNEIRDTHILDALMAVPREYFAPENLLRASHVDADLPLGNNRYQLAPLTFARMLTLADVQPSDRVLDVGCGFGYTTAVLSHLAKLVVGCEFDRAMAEEAHRHMTALDIKRAHVVQVNNMAEGYSTDAPYDVIFIQGAVEAEPERLLSLLKNGGRLVCVKRAAVAGPGAQGLGKITLYTSSQGQTFSMQHMEASASVLPGFEAQARFTL